ncbi:MAG: hypothetical protein GY832_01820 [Chloroflexi bacterium]|nr:hypothetical protein [Chloroflexota bacterium]
MNLGPRAMECGGGSWVVVVCGFGLVSVRGGVREKRRGVHRLPQALSPCPIASATDATPVRSLAVFPWSGQVVSLACALGPGGGMRGGWWNEGAVPFGGTSLGESFGLLWWERGKVLWGAGGIYL